MNREYPPCSTTVETTVPQSVISQRLSPTFSHCGLWCSLFFFLCSTYIYGSEPSHLEISSAEAQLGLMEVMGELNVLLLSYMTF